MQSPFTFVDVFQLPKRHFDNSQGIIGIDRGCALTKVVYFPKQKSEINSIENGWTELHCATFLNSKFVEGLEYVKKVGCLSDSDLVHVSGSGGEKFQQLIEETLKVKTTFIPELQCQLIGIQFLINNLPHEEIFFSSFEIKPELPFNGGFECLRQHIEKEVTQNNTKSESSLAFPFIFASLGAGADFIKFTDKENAVSVDTHKFCGQTLMGLAGILLGLTNYDEFLNLAAEGDGHSTDWLLSDMLPLHSPYADLPKDRCIFAFGRLADYNFGNLEFSRPDIARSLIKLVVQCITTALFETCRDHHINRIIFGGNLVRSELVRSIIDEIFELNGIQHCFDFKFLKAGYTECIGALMANPEKLKN